MKAERDATLVMDALMMAVWRRGKADALLHHSDQGSQYTSEQFQRLLADNGIICSMSRAGNVWDNSAAEVEVLPHLLDRIWRFLGSDLLLLIRLRCFYCQ